MITSTAPSSWQVLREQSARILAECGFAIEVEKKVKLATRVAAVPMGDEVDAKSIPANAVSRPGVSNAPKM